MRTLRILLVVLTAAATPLGTLGQSSNYTFTQIQSLDNYAGYFEPATINNRGDVLFAPALPNGYEGVLLWRKGNLTTIAEGGQVMPLPDGGVLGYTFSPVAMNDNGEVAFIMSRDGYNFSANGLNAGVYRYSSRTGVDPVMVPGAQTYDGNAFFGSFYFPSINNRGDIVVPAIFCTSIPTSVGTLPCLDGSARMLSKGIFQADSKGAMIPVAVAGVPAPGGTSYFDNAQFPRINDRGDIAFMAHVYGEPCTSSGILVCDRSLYLKRYPSGTIEKIATVGSPSPAGKNYSSIFSPAINATADLAFLGDLSTTDSFEVAVFLYTGGRTIVIAKPGDPMPGGGTFASNGPYQQDVNINDRGEVVFAATLIDGANGLYVWRHGVVSLVARTGIDTGTGVILNLDDFGAGMASSQVSINNAGRILFSARYFGGGGGLLVATPN